MVRCVYAVQCACGANLAHLHYPARTHARSQTRSDKTLDHIDEEKLNHRIESGVALPPQEPEKYPGDFHYHRSQKSGLLRWQHTLEFRNWRCECRIISELSNPYIS